MFELQLIKWLDKKVKELENLSHDKADVADVHDLKEKFYLMNGYVHCLNCHVWTNAGVYCSMDCAQYHMGKVDEAYYNKN